MSGAGNKGLLLLSGFESGTLLSKSKLTLTTKELLKFS
jgi:hypothetical protein